MNTASKPHRQALVSIPFSRGSQLLFLAINAFLV